MRALLLAVVVVAAVFAWILLAPPRAPEDVGGVEPGAPPPPAAPAERGASSPSLTAEPPRDTEPRAAPGDPRAPEPPARGKANLVVVPVPPAGGQVPADLRADIERVGARLATQPLPMPLEDGRLRYEGLPAGDYRVRLFSDVLVDSVGEVTLRDGGEETLEVKLVPGGFARVTVTLYNGEAPTQVTYSLRDARGQPVPARYEGRSAAGPTTSPRLAERVTMPAEVVVSGLKPGTYTLRATSPADEFEEGKLDVQAGEGATLALKVRR